MVAGGTDTFPAAAAGVVMTRICSGEGLLGRPSTIIHSGVRCWPGGAGYPAARLATPVSGVLLVNSG